MLQARHRYPVGHLRGPYFGNKVLLFYKGGELSESPKMLIEEAKKQGLSLVPAAPKDFLPVIGGFNNNKPSILEGVTGILTHVGSPDVSDIVEFTKATATLGWLQTFPNIFFPNKLTGIEIASDKWKTHCVLQQAGLRQPETYLITSLTEGLELINKLKWNTGFIKTLTGSKGEGVFYGKTQEELKKILKQHQDKLPLLLQKPIVVGNQFKDIRVFVVDGQVIGAMERTAKEGSAIANIAQGATAKQFELTTEIKSMALTASKVLGLNITGVDIIIGQDGKPYIIEINDSPGLSGITQALGNNRPAEAIIALLKKGIGIKRPAKTIIGWLNKVAAAIIGWFKKGMGIK